MIVGVYDVSMYTLTLTFLLHDRIVVLKRERERDGMEEAKIRKESAILHSTSEIHNDIFRPNQITKETVTWGHLDYFYTVIPRSYLEALVILPSHTTELPRSSSHLTQSYHRATSKL
jgi:hypothetical protein